MIATLRLLWKLVGAYDCYAFSRTTSFSENYSALMITTACPWLLRFDFSEDYSVLMIATACPWLLRFESRHKSLRKIDTQWLLSLRFRHGHYYSNSKTSNYILDESSILNDHRLCGVVVSRRDPEMANNYDTTIIDGSSIKNIVMDSPRIIASQPIEPPLRLCA